MLFGLLVVLACTGPFLVLADNHVNHHARRASSNSTSLYATRFPNVTWDHENWQITTTNLDQGHFQSRMVVANGYHGVNVAALGPFFEVDVVTDGAVVINGWPLFDRRQSFATIGGFWDSQPKFGGSGTNYPWLSQYGWDSAISGIPHWGGIVLDLGNSEILDASTSNSSISGFSSTLDMKHGLMNWAFTWNTSQGPLDITYQMFAHKVYVNQGFVNLTVIARNSVNFTAVNVLNGDCALRTQSISKGNAGNLVYSAVQPNGVPNVTAYIYAGMTVAGAQLSVNHTSWNASYVGSNQSSIANAMGVTLQPGQTATFIKYAGLASSDGFTNPQQVAMNAVAQAMQTGYLSSLQSHVAEWEAVFPRSSVDDFVYPGNGSLPSDPYVVEAAITAVTNPYHILQNTISANAATAAGNASINSHSVAVGGLGSESYAGQIFWDAETWMQPGIVAAFPYAAQGFSNYRLKLHSQAIANAQTSYVSSKNNTNFSSTAAIYPWTSGRFGNCTATGPCWDYEYHINGDIIQAMTNLWLASGSESLLQDSLYPVHLSIATMYSEVLQQNGSYWSLANMTDPDEYANNKDNGAYTMALIAEVLESGNILRQRFNQSVNQTWNQQAQNVLIGKSDESGITLEYTGPEAMNGSVQVKQADVVLIPFPLSYSTANYTGSDAFDDLEYYADKQSPDGPGMTYAIFSIVANEASPSGCAAYTYQQYSYQPYVRAPWFQFSEQEIDNPAVNGGTNPAFPFLTGHGGANQVVLFGYLGLRYIADGYLHVDPAPPQQIPYIKYRTFYWQGWPIQAASNATHTTLQRAQTTNSASGVYPNSTFTNAPIPVMVGPRTGNQTRYELPVSGVLVLENRRYYLNKAVQNNVAQCQPVASSDDFLPGQFPISAVDGVTSTRWQPVFANRTASITVQLPLGYLVEGFEFNWSAQPPYNYTIRFHNDTDPSSVASQSVVNSTQVDISEPYNATSALEVRAVTGNATVMRLSQGDSPIYTAHYATLSIWGNQANGNLTVDTMSGDGATVAEWSIIVGNNGMNTSTGSPYMKRSNWSMDMNDVFSRFQVAGEQIVYV